MAEKQKRAREEGWGSERAMLAGCNLSFRIWMSSHLHFRAPSLDLHSLVVKTIDFKTDELLVRCNLSGVESDGHLHGPSRAKDARWAAHLQVRGAFEQAAQAGRKHKGEAEVSQGCVCSTGDIGAAQGSPIFSLRILRPGGPGWSFPGCVILARGPCCCGFPGTPQPGFLSDPRSSEQSGAACSACL